MIKTPREERKASVQKGQNKTVSQQHRGKRVGGGVTKEQRD